MASRPGTVDEQLTSEPNFTASELHLHTFEQRKSTDPQRTTAVMNPGLEEVPGPGQPLERPDRQRPILHRTIEGVGRAAEIFQNETMYRNVTCPFWKWQGRCRFTENDCVFSHSDTGIDAPFRRKPAKHFTCYAWRVLGRCQDSEHSCLYAHRDTGLYVGRDNKASVKHITCYWWNHGGRCKHREEDCLYAHRDTGLYARDPGENPPPSKNVSCDLWKQHNSAPRSDKVWSSDNQSEPDVHAVNHSEKRLSTGSQQAHRTFVAEAPSSDQRLPVEDWTPKSSSRQLTSFVPPGSAQLHLSQPTFSTHIDGQITTKIPQTNIKISVLDAAPQAQHEADQSTSSVHPQTPTSNDIKFGGREAISTARIEVSSGDDTHTWTQKVPRTPHRDYRSNQAEESGWPTENGPESHRAASSLLEASTFSVRVPSAPIRHLAKRTGTISDPRKKKQEALAATPLLTERSGHSTAGVDPRTVDPVAPVVDDVSGKAPGSSPTSNDVTRLRGLKRCEVCSKSCLNSSLCTGCKSKDEQQQNNDLQKSPPRPDPSRASRELSNHDDPLSNFGMVEAISDIDLTLILAANPVAEVNPLNSLKRRAPEEHLFVRKKQKPNGLVPTPFLTTRQGPADTIPEETRTAADAESDSFPSPKGPTGHAGQGMPLLERSVVADPRDGTASQLQMNHESAPSLQELTMLERLKKGKLPIVARTASPDQLEKGQVHNNFRKAEDGATEQNRSLGQPVEDELFPTGVNGPRETEEETGPLTMIETNGTIAVTAGNIPAASPFDFSDTSNTSSSVSNTTNQAMVNNNGQASNSIRRPTCATCRAKHRRCYHKVSDGADESPGALALPSANFERPCDMCRKQHKACLHDENGDLDPLLCKRFLEKRKYRPDPGRPKKENDAIVAVAQCVQDESPSTHQIVRGGHHVRESEQPINETGQEEPHTETECSADELMLDGGTDDEDNTPLALRRPLVRRQWSRGRQPPISVARKADQQVWTPEDERRAMDELQERGVMFESDSDSDSPFEEQPARAHQTRRVDPLWQPTTSLDLFEIAPSLNPARESTTVSYFPRGRGVKPPKKHVWKNLLAYQCRERRIKLGNPHWEVDRKLSPRIVTAVIEQEVDDDRAQTPNPLAIREVEKKTVEMSFPEFLGMPREPVVCYGKSKKELAFRDRKNDRDKDFFRRSRAEKRVTDDEKFPFGTGG